MGEPELEAFGDAADKKVLDYVNHHQEQDNWCWAAVSLSVDEFYARQSGGATTWSQCTIVNAELAQADCCENGSERPCNRPWYVHRALARVRRFRRTLGRRLRLIETKIQVDADQPYAIRIGWHRGGGHFIAAYGYDATSRTLHIADPWFGDDIQDHDTFPRHYQGGGRWTHTYATRQ